MRDLKTTIKLLGQRERNSDKKGYGGDATDHAFKRHLLILLSGLVGQKSKRKPTEYQKIVGQQLKAGNSLKLAHKTAKEILNKKK